MSYQYNPQYPQYPQPPQPPAGLGGAPGGSLEPPPDKPGAQPAYEPLPSGLNFAEIQSLHSINVAAGKPPAEYGVKAPDAPAEYPFLMYNSKDGTTKAAKDAKDKADLAGKGFSENPPPPDPYALTAQMLQDLQIVWQKAGDALTQLMQLVEQQQKQMQAASGILGGGQQQQPPAPGWGQPQPPQQGYSPQTPGD